MTIDPGKEVRSLFAKAVLEHEAAKDLNAEELVTYRKINRDHAAQVRFEERRYELEYRTRFEVARQRIIDRGGAKDRKLTHRWFGSDRFNATAIDRQADREVRHEHANLIARLGQERDGRMKVLFAAAEERRALGSELKRDFERTADRRPGPDRRRGPAR